MKRAIPVALAALSLLAGIRVAHATTTPVVAVMPFKDLSGARGSIGEAIRETVTTDLKGVPGLRVIERGDLDQVLAEQNLQARKADLDPLSTVKVGKLLGASLIVAGAYQRAASSVRLTARFVRVETGEIVGTAKVDGRAADFLSLQDKVTVQLLRSAGLRGERVQLFAKRVRPKLKSLKTIELYGDAVVEKDDKKKEDLLKLALNEDPGFVYASRDLDELEKRLKRYDTAYQRETDRQLQALLSSVHGEKDPQKLMMGYSQIFGKLQMQRRWYTLERLSREVVAHPPPKAPPPFPDIAEMAQMNLVTCAQMRRNDDAVLREGEKFLAKYPTSNFFGSVRAQMDAAIERKRAVEEGKQKVAQDLSQMEPSHRADPCMVAQKYNENKQAAEARHLFEQCLATGSRFFTRPVTLELLVTVTLAQGDFPATRRYLDQLKAADPKIWKTISAVAVTMPTDQ